jgi:hypothetical protein
MGLAIMQDFNRQDRERVLSGTVLVVPGGVDLTVQRPCDLYCLEHARVQQIVGA